MTLLSRDASAPVGQTLVDLGRATAMYQDARDRFADADVAGLSDAWMRIENAPAVARYEQAVERVEAHPFLQPADDKWDPAVVLPDLIGGFKLEAKSNALASCDFGNPSLSTPLPGRLGRSIESSVQTFRGLSRSATSFNAASHIRQRTTR